MQNNELLLLGMGCLIIAILAAYAGMLLARLKRQRQQRRELEKQAVNERKEKIAESIRIISDAMLRDECDISEGSIRLVKLLTAIPASEPKDWPTEYPSLFEFYDRIKHMPIMDARKALAKKERRKLDKERLGYSAQASEQIKAEIAGMVTFSC